MAIIKEEGTTAFGHEYVRLYDTETGSDSGKYSYGGILGTCSSKEDAETWATRDIINQIEKDRDS